MLRKKTKKKIKKMVMSKQTLQIEAIRNIIQACATLGWVCSFRSRDAIVRYMIIGEDAMVDKIVGKIDGKRLRSKKNH